MNEALISKTCWAWRGATDRRGYGKVTIDGRSVGAHRVAWEEAHGPITDGRCVLHRCDVPCCVNPDHLFLGTHADNMRDCGQKGRQPGNSKLNRDDVDQIRALTGFTQREIAEAYRVSRATVSLIRNRKTWQ